MEAMDDPNIEEIAIQKCTQCGASALLCNCALKHIDVDPCPIMVVQPTEDDGKDFLSQKLLPLIESTPQLRRKVRQSYRGQAGGSTTTRLMFPGGFLQMASASSPASAQSKSIRILFADELDEWPPELGSGGDPFRQFRARMRTFWNRKLIALGKPKVEGRSRIARLYQDSDQRRYHVPCPACGLMQVLTWAACRWPEDKPELAMFHCTKCDHGIDDNARMVALSKGRWIATKPGGKRAGFHVPSWITPWVRSMGLLAADFLEAKRAGPEQLQVWINSEAAETWTEAGEQLKPDDLEGRAESYPVEPLREGVLALTVGGDVQADRVELEVVGWGAGRECWSVDYFRVMGDPDSPALWADVDALLYRKWRHPDGYTLGVSAACIDSGGHHTQAVYRFCTPRAGRRIYAIKGRGGKVAIWARAEKRRNIRERGHGHPVHIVGVDSAKESVYHSLRRVAPGPGYCHLPDRYPPEWFAQLTAEERVPTNKGIAWHRKGSQPNEAWDCRVYALAALEALTVGGLDLERLAAVRAHRAATRETSTVPPAYASLPKGRRVRSAGLGG